MAQPHSIMPSSCRLPHHFPVYLATLIFFLCVFTHHGYAAEETGKIQANPVLAAELRQRDNLRASVKPFFVVNNDFLNIVQQNYLKGPVISDLIGNITEEKNRTLTDYWNIAVPVIITYPGYVALFLFGLLLTLLVPIIGFFWCICRCCCRRCGARAKPMDGKYARCRRGTFGIFLGMLCTFILAASVLAFISNDLLHRPFMIHSPDNPVTKVNSSLNIIVDNLQTILKNFNNQTLNRLIKQLPKVKNAIEGALMLAQKEIIRKSAIGALISKWHGIDIRLTTYMNVTKSIQASLENLTSDYNDLASDFPAMKETLRDAFNSCTVAECNAATLTLSNFDIAFSVARVNSALVGRILQSLSAINNTEMTENLALANETLNNFAELAINISRSEIDNVVANLNDSRRIEAYFVNSEAFIRNITWGLELITRALNNQTFNNRKMRPFIAEIDRYRMYAFIGLASIILIIIVFYYLALCFGACGEPPYEDARFCNRGKAASLMSCGVGFTIIFFPIIMLVTMAHFMAGGPVRTELCRYLLGEIPNGYSKLDFEISHILRSLDFSFAPGFPYPPNLTYHIMGTCANGTSIVTAFSLEDLINGTTMYTTEVRPSLLNLQQTVRKVDLNIDVSELVTQGGNFIDTVQKYGINRVSIASSITELQTNIINDFNRDIAIFRAAEAKLSPPNPDVNSTLETMITQVNSVNKSKLALIPSYQSVSSVGDIQNEIAKLRGNLQEFGFRLKKESAFLTTIIDNSLTTLDKTVQKVLVDAVKVVLNEYASCRVLHEQVKALVNLVCVDILNPFNGLWLGTGLCLLILLPAMILGCKLNYLYRKTEYYVKDYEEPDYMSYQVFYPSDNIPLERTSSGIKLLGLPKSEHHA